MRLAWSLLAPRQVCRMNNLHPLFQQILSAHCEHSFDRALPGEPRCDEREYEPPELTPEQDRGALRCSTMSEAVALHAWFPAATVIISSAARDKTATLRHYAEMDQQAVDAIDAAKWRDCQRCEAQD